MLGITKTLYLHVFVKLAVYIDKSIYNANTIKHINMHESD